MINTEQNTLFKQGNVTAILKDIDVHVYYTFGNHTIDKITSTICYLVVIYAYSAILIHLSNFIRPQQCCPNFKECNFSKIIDP